MTDGGLQNLSDGFKRLKSLEEVILSFTSCQQISDKGLESLSTAIKGASALKNLSLDFTGSILLRKLN